MTEKAPDYNEAEALRKAGKHAEAVGFFAALWQKGHSPYTGWRYANCLRKIGQLELAEQVARAALEKFPVDKYTRGELRWILYEKELKPAKDDSDLGRAIHFAQEIFQLGAEGLILARVVLSVMKVAKGRVKWDVVLEWANKVQAADLSAESMMIDGKRGMADRETWYVGKARALLELERYAEARTFAQQGLAEFPGELFLARTAALALARSGDVQHGATEIRSLLGHRLAGWYVKADLAELEYRLGNHSEAYRLMCEAISNPQEDEYKLTCFVTLAEIALSLNKLDVAAEHVALAKAVRAQNNWSLPDKLFPLTKVALQL